MEENGKRIKCDNYDGQIYRHCQICTEEISWNQFQDHVNTHTVPTQPRQTEPTIPCQLWANPEVRTSYIYTLVQYQCPRCPMIFNQMSNTRDHLVSFHLEEETKVDRIEIHRVGPSTATQTSEEIASKRLRNSRGKKTVNTVEEMNRSVDRQYKLCPICNNHVTLTSFKRHMDVHRGIRYQCPRCPKTFSRAGDTRFHLINVHEEEKRNVRRMKIKQI